MVLKTVLNMALPVLMACCVAVPALAAPAGVALSADADGPALDLDIDYYTRVLTPEGVTREARYKETMLRRSGHVWVARVLPKGGVARQDKHPGDKNQGHGASEQGVAGHAEFNYVVNPRHVMLESNKVRIDYIDVHGKAVVAIPASEYANVNFDGSWGNAFFLLDPTLLKTIPLTAKPSSVVGARWREREKNGVFERVLWDDKRKIPLVIESGDKASTFYRRIEVTARAKKETNLPWNHLSGYAQKEFSDYLD
jgi:hypothetical protein